MMRRAALAMATALLTTGCSSALMPPRGGPQPDELAEMKRRILELQREAAMTRVEIDRLRQQVAALEAGSGGGGAPTAEVEPPPAPAAVGVPARPEPTVEVTDLEMGPQEMSQPAAPRPAEPPPVPAASAPPAGGPAAPVSEAAQAMYDRGYTLYHQGRHVDAETSFRRFLQAYPDTSLSDNAQYWIGESRFARQDFAGALAAFREAAERYPGGNKVADSLLKAADCLQRLGDTESARSTYEEVIRRFPGSAAAAMAEERRGQLPP